MWMALRRRARAWTVVGERALDVVYAPVPVTIAAIAYARLLPAAHCHSLPSGAGYRLRTYCATARGWMNR